MIGGTYRHGPTRARWRAKSLRGAMGVRDIPLDTGANLCFANSD